MDEKSEQRIGDTKYHRLWQKSKFWLAFSGILATLAVTALAATWIVMPPASKASNEIMFTIVKIDIHISLYLVSLFAYLSHETHFISTENSKRIVVEPGGTFTISHRGTHNVTHCKIKPPYPKAELRGDFHSTPYHSEVDTEPTAVR